MLDRAAVGAAARQDGKWVVMSNCDTLTAAGLVLGYQQSRRVEHCWW